jgi:hypothetical protein
MNMKKKNGYVNRDYRILHQAGDMEYFNVKIKDSDLAIGIDCKSYKDDLQSICYRELARIRGELEDYIAFHPEFKASFVPLKLRPGAPEIASSMSRAASSAGVGPMAAVAGAFAQVIGEKLKSHANEIIVENGGDIYLDSSRRRIIAVFAGKSKFTYKIGINVSPQECPLGICTSSGTVGHSISLGKADAVVVKGMPVAVADAVATRVGNMIKTENDLLKAIDFVKNIQQVRGILAIKNDKMAAWGEIEIVPLTEVNNDESSR